jgi:hypothetical protein
MYIFPTPSSFQQEETIAKKEGKGEWQNGSPAQEGS